jgi:hypothetical protein
MSQVMPYNLYSSNLSPVSHSLLPLSLSYVLYSVIFGSKHLHAGKCQILFNLHNDSPLSSLAVYDVTHSICDRTAPK